MFKAKANDQITCINGHLRGHFLNDVKSDKPITQADLYLECCDVTGLKAAYFCQKCNDQVAVFCEGAAGETSTYKVHTDAGWVS